MPTGLIRVNELKNAFFSIRTNKCPGHGEISFNVIRNCFGKLYEPLQYLFNLSSKLVAIQNPKDLSALCTIAYTNTY